MSYSETEKAEFAARGRWISDRLSDRGERFEPMIADPIENVIETWRENVADGDEAAFRRRLLIEGETEDSLSDTLRTCDFPESEPLPDWVELIDELQSYLEDEAVPSVGADDDDDEEPFEHILTPIVEFATAQLDRVTTTARFSDAAVRDCRTELRADLETLFTHALFIDFKVFLRNTIVGNEGDPESRVGYRAFVERKLDDGLGEFFLEYAVLARWTAIYIERWVANLEEFIDRLERDWSRLEASFGDGTTLETVTGVTFHGDPHHGRRRVIGVEFGSGTTVAYKPRSIAPEASYYAFLSWLNEESPLPEFRIVDCISNPGYGWMEWIEPADCGDWDEISQYFRRVGSLICVLYSLRFSDGNLENIIAASDQPVLLDLEALLQPDLRNDHIFGDPDLHELFSESVAETGLIPLDGGDENIAKVNGIDKPRAERTAMAQRRFEQINTDAMDLSFEDAGYIEGNSLPRYNGETFDPREHVDEIIDGFETAYEFFLANRSRILAEDGPLQLFSDIETRFFYRDTNTYEKVRRPLSTSRYLRSGLACAVKIELLVKWIDWEDFKADQWRVYEAEREALWQHDVPRFTVNSSERSLQLGTRTLESRLDRTPMNTVRRRIESMDRKDLGRQVDYLVNAYAPGDLLNPSPPTDGYTASVPESWTSVARRECDAIFERIRTAAVRKPDGELAWYSRGTKGSGIFIQRLRDDIYDGRLGIGVFTAAMAAVLNREDCHRFTETVTAPLLEALEDDRSRFADKKLGAGHGLGSLVYGFTKIGTWLDDPRYTSAALDLSSFITAERAAEDDILDLLGGAAGAILGLLALYERTDDDRVLERATRVGEALLESRVEREGVLAWPTDDGGALNGPGHGISGIAFPLYRLGTVRGDSRFTDAALEGLRFEDAYYSPTEQNWIDTRRDRYRPGWCAGRSGAGLTRLSMLEMAPTDTFRRDVERALDGLDPETLMTEDHLCCGNFSRVEFLLEAADVLDDRRCATRAERLAARVLDRAESEGSYAIPWQSDYWYSTSLYLGEPGIGYSLLRLADGELPCLLRWG